MPVCILSHLDANVIHGCRCVIHQPEVITAVIQDRTHTSTSLASFLEWLQRTRPLDFFFTAKLKYKLVMLAFSQEFCDMEATTQSGLNWQVLSLVRPGWWSADWKQNWTSFSWLLTIAMRYQVPMTTDATQHSIFLLVALYLLWIITQSLNNYKKLICQPLLNSQHQTNLSLSDF